MIRTLILAAALFAVAVPALAADELNASTGLTAEGAPLALHGFDPVAYFTEGAPRQGRADLAQVHDGATYYFASKQNRAAFAKQPERYAPAYGGFCAYGVSVGKKFDGDPRFFTLEGGRLFLNLNADISAKFQDDLAGSIERADTHWRTIEHTSIGDL